MQSLSASIMEAKSHLESRTLKAMKITDGVTLTEVKEQIETTGLKGIDIAPA